MSQYKISGHRLEISGRRLEISGRRLEISGRRLEIRAAKTKFAWREWRKMLGLNVAVQLRIGAQITRKYARNLFIDVYTINFYSIPR